MFALNIPELEFTGLIFNRNAFKFKFAPVDHNMYPAGFNNLCSKDLLQCADIFKEYFNSLENKVKNIFNFSAFCFSAIWERIYSE